MKHDTYRWLVLLWVLIHSTLSFAVKVDGIYSGAILGNDANYILSTIPTVDRSESGETVYVMQKDDAHIGGSISEVGGIKLTFDPSVTDWRSGGSGSDAQEVDGVALSGYYTQSDKTNKAPIILETTKPGKLTIFFGGGISKAINMTEGENGLTGKVLSSGASVESGSAPATAINAWGGICYDLEANKTYIFSCSGTKWRLAAFRYIPSTLSFAYDAEVDGIYYNLNTSAKTAEVTYKTTDYGSYSGKIVIPASISSNGTTYSVTSIGNSAFRGCSDLTSVTIPNSVTSIVSSAFSGCSGLTSITIPSSVTSIGSFAFGGCSSLTAVHISDLLAWCKIVFYYSSGNPLYYAHHLYLNGKEIKDLVVPSSVTSIGSYAFEGCSGLTSVTIPNSVTSIGEEAFAYCSGLTSLTIGNKVTSIGPYAYFGCSNMEIVKSKILNPFSISVNVFQNISSSSVLQVPVGTKNQYEELSGWISNFQKIIEEEEETTTYMLSITVSGNGSATYNNTSIRGGTQSFTVNSGTSATVLFSPDTGYRIASVKVNNTDVTSSVSNNKYTISNITANTTLSVTFEAIPVTTYTLSVTSSGSGSTSYNGTTIRGGNQSFTVNSGTSATISFTPDTGYRIASVKVNNIDVTSSVSNNKYTISNITANTTLAVTFEAIPVTAYTLSITASGNGSATYNSTSIRSKTQSFTVNSGTSATVSFSPDTGYRIASVKVNNTDVTSNVINNQYTISNITSNTTLSVTFEELVNALTVDGIAYNLNHNAKTAEVTSGTNKYSGKVVIPSSINYNGTTYNVTSIGSKAFSACSGLTSVTIPNSMTSIGDFAFDGCLGLTAVTIPENVTKIGNAAFRDCPSLASIIVDNGNKTFDSRGNCNAVINTSTNELVFGCKNTVIPNSVTSIGMDAFRGCTGLTSMTIPNGVTNIGHYAFGYCSGLTSVTIPSSVTHVGSYAFDGCSGLTSVSIPNSVTYLGSYAFEDCSGLTSVTISNRMTSINDETFKRCTSLTSIDIPNSVTTIGTEAFRGCSSLTSVTIPNSVTKIGPIAFGYCTSLASVTIPSSVTSIGSYAFTDCPALASIEVDNGNTTFDSRDNCNAIILTSENMLLLGCKNTIIPNSVTSIGSSAFTRYPDLTAITIPNSVTIIGGLAFDGCNNLKAITIPNSVTQIGDYAFQYCSSLREVKSEIINPFEIDKGVFRYIHSEATLLVPEGTKEKYQAYEGWTTYFKEIIEEEEPVTELTADGINYAVVSQPEKTIKVAGVNNDQVLTVPATVTQNGKTWTVTGIDNNALKDNKELAAVIWNPEAAFTATVSNPNLLLYVNQEQYAPAAIKNVIVNGTANSITLTEAQSGNDFYCPQAFTARNISYTHRYGMQTGIGESRGWETIALPFDVQRISHETKGDITPFALWKSGDASKPFWLYELTGSGFTEADGIKAYTPYIISMPNNPKYDSQWLLNGNVTFSASNVTVGKTENVKTATYRDQTFIPNYADKSAAEGLLALNVVNDFATNNSGMTEGSKFVLNMRQVHPFEAYMTTTSNARQVIDIFEDMTTDIKTLGVWEQCSGDDSLYDLQGRKVSHATKGVYVNKKGQKRIIK